MASDAKPDGLLYVADFLSADEEESLLRQLSSLPFHAVEMHGVTARRTTVHYGWDYGYESWRIEPAPPMPPFLDGVRARAAALIEVGPEQLEEVLVTRYPPGAGIGWHRDAPMFGPAVVGISLGAACEMRFRRRGESRTSYRLPLAPRSAYVLGGASRTDWQHTISPQKQERYSITFRTIKPRTRPRRSPP